MEDPKSSRGTTQPKGAGTDSVMPASLGIGTVLDGVYELESHLGEGAMGMVYLARDTRLDRRVAIKFIQPDLVESDDSQDRFLSEARLMARVRHVNVVEIHAYGDYHGSPYFVMEFVDGETVEDWIRTHARPHLAIDEAVGILDQTCRGVTAIHAAGAVHRDLKPTNVLIGTAFRVCVTDLGLARKLDRVNREIGDTVSGTPAYMAPELVLGTTLPPELDAAADIYSLGVMAFEMFTGRLPYQYDHPSQMMAAHVQDIPPLPSELRADLPEVFDEVILAAMDKKPAQRTASAEAFRRQLADARAQANAPKRRRRFLVADDDEDFRDLLAATLSYAFPDANVVAVADGDAALEAMTSNPADLALLDLDMPGLNGVELTAAFRGTKGLESMPILVVTATGGAPDWRLLSSLGADGFLVKPIDPTGLVALVRRTLAGR
ncbi:MAG: protein kinase [Sandaracinaceae bacterium]